MHPREVAEVGEVLDLSRGLGVPGEGPARDGLPARRLELGEVGERPPRLLGGDPDQPVALPASVGGDASAGRHPGRVLELRDRGAASVGGVAPPVVRAHDLVAGHAAEGERRAAVDAQVGKGVGRAGAVPPDDQRFAQEDGAMGGGPHLARVGNPVPAGPEALEARGRHQSLGHGHPGALLLVLTSGRSCLTAARPALGSKDDWSSPRAARASAARPALGSSGGGSLARRAVLQYSDGARPPVKRRELGGCPSQKQRRARRLSSARRPRLAPAGGDRPDPARAARPGERAGRSPRSRPG